MGGGKLRPNRLEMSAFGPYGEVQVIDFDQLGTEGLYLITGDTGAGKTTIFDGIVYALYGEASGDYRESGMLRSQYAKPETTTYVKLDFTYQGRLYSIYRNPAYERKKLRGEGVTKEEAHASLKLPSGEEISKIGDVNQKITSLLGLDVHQFKQIGMIAQGDFLKLLVANTKERSEIFREIFHTKRYEDLQNKLKEAARDITLELKASDEEIARLLEDSFVKPLIENHTFEEAFQELIKEVQRFNEQIEIQGRAKAQRQNERLALLQEITLLEQVSKKLEEKERLEKQLLVLEENLDQSTRQMKEAIRLQEEQSRIKEDIYGLQKDLVAYEHREKLLEEKGKIKEKLRILENRPSILKEEIHKLEKVLEEKKAFLHQEPALIEEKANLSERIKKDQIRLEEIRKEGEYYKELVSLKDRLKTQLDLWRKKKDKFQKEQAQLEKEEHLFWQGQAGMMAKELKEGEPCPVCGSKAHPHLATISSVHLTREMIEQKRKEVDKGRNELDDLSHHLSQQRAICEEKETQLLHRLTLLVGPLTFEEIKDRCQLYYYEVKKSGDNHQKQLAKNQDLLTQMKEDKVKIKEIEEVISEKKDELSKNASWMKEKETSYKHIVQQLEELKARLEFESLDLAKHGMKTKKETLDKVSSQIEKIRTFFEQAKSELDKHRSAYEQLIKDIPTGEMKDIQQLKTLSDELEDQIKILEAEEKEKFTLLKKNEEIIERLKEGFQKLQSREKAYRMIVPLAETACAGLKGKARVQLETYVQMTYFERILQRANVRFMKMSQGKYELVRKEDADSLKGQSGLDLDIIDHYSGKRRSVKTLSGGESFQASLSLALGLSDEIQSSSGGIRLDSMFIDEGFGTLDSASLDQAMKALSSLASHDKLIGIISHVGELKERIDKKIIVQKDPSGKSYAKIVL